MIQRRNSTSTEEVEGGSQIPASLPKYELVDVRKDIRSLKTRSNIPMDRQLLYGDKVAKGWLSTLSCWEAAVHTLD